MLLNQTINDVFSTVATRTPGRIALVDDSGETTYGQLAARSDEIARGLSARGIGTGHRVGVYAQRSAAAVAALLGILKSGAAFVPFDPAYPRKLLSFVYADCTPSLMLVQHSLLGAEPAFWNGEGVEIVNAFSDAPAGPPPVLVSRDDPAYIMYTSGSTGQPKGVLVPHRGVVRLVIDNDFAEMGSEQVHLQLAPLAFDASTFEIWGALLHGAKLAVVASAYPSLDEIGASIARHGVTTLWLTAGLFHLMIENRIEALRPLRQLIAGGDVLSPPHVARALEALPQCQLINGYGPTENTTFTCCYRIPRDFKGGALPIGRAVAHTQVYVLDELGRPLGDEQEGELYAGGDGVALGYWRRPELTRERFIEDRFAAAAGRPTGKLYRTGDRVRRRADGNHEFLGRADRQIKISGKRVELDEIENTLRASGQVADAAVVSPASVGVESRKVHAFVTALQARSVALPDLKAFLKNSLPDYMFPASITVMESLPLSPTGKVDRNRLLVPASAPAVGASAAVPGNPLEAQLLDIWRAVLSNDSIGVEDNFFEVGGTSLQLIQVHAKITAVMYKNLTIVELFQFPSVSALAAHLHAPESRPVAAAVVALSAEERARRQREALSRARSNPRRQAR